MPFLVLRTRFRVRKRLCAIPICYEMGKHRYVSSLIGTNDSIVSGGFGTAGRYR